MPSAWRLSKESIPSIFEDMKKGMEERKWNALRNPHQDNR